MGLERAPQRRLARAGRTVEQDDLGEMGGASRRPPPAGVSWMCSQRTPLAQRHPA
ncbi:MAG: hypothetical protein R2851_25485 [Caldilineaceae bacterium]